MPHGVRHGDGARTARLLLAGIQVAMALGSSAPVDLTFVGIGENGHLAINDPPADFLAGELDEAYRQQQVNEGWLLPSRRCRPILIPQSLWIRIPPLYSALC